MLPSRVELSCRQFLRGSEFEEASMQGKCLDCLKKARQLGEGVEEQLEDCAKLRFVAGDEAREAMLLEIHRIRLTLSMARRNLTTLAAVANRKNGRREKDSNKEASGRGQ
jgi:hypothetical protein